MVADEKVAEIIQLMEEDPSSIEFKWVNLLIGNPELRRDTRIIDAMFHIYKEVLPEIGDGEWEIYLKDLLMYPEWRENARTLELIAWTMKQCGSWSLVILEDDCPELLENEIILQAISGVISKSRFAETFCIYDVLKFSHKHQVVLNSEVVRQGLLSSTKRIGEALANFREVCSDSYDASFCDMIQEIRKFDFLYNDDNMQRELVAIVPIITEFLIDHRSFGGGYSGDYVLENILGIPAYTSHYDIQIAIFYFLTEIRKSSHYHPRREIDWVERLREDDILKESPLVQAGFSKFKRDKVEFSDEDIEFILNGIRDSKFPWLSFIEIQKIPKLWNNDQISKLLYSRIDDIAYYIQTVQYVTTIVLYICRDSILMNSSSIVQALGPRVNEIEFIPPDANLLIEVAKGEAKFDDLMDKLGIRWMDYQALSNPEILKKVQSDPNLQYEEEFQKQVIQYIISIRKQEVDFKRELDELDWVSEAKIEEFRGKMDPIYKVFSDLGGYQGLMEDKDIQQTLVQLIKDAPDLRSFLLKSKWFRGWTIDDIHQRLGPK